MTNMDAAVITSRMPSSEIQSKEVLINIKTRLWSNKECISNRSKIKK